MATAAIIDSETSTRELIRRLRGTFDSTTDMLPESVAWHTYLELRRRGETRATPLFLGALKNLHSRRSISSVVLPTEDPLKDEHRLIEDPYLAELWKAYKKCICSQCTGPARQLLRDIEKQVQN